jgi:hypothetical protein
MAVPEGIQCLRDGVRSVGTLASLDLADVGTMVVPKGIQYHFISFHTLR